MASISSTPIINYIQTSIPIFKGEAYEFWSIQMQTLLISQDLWELVEEGYHVPRDQEELSRWAYAKQLEYNLNKQKDAKALYFLQQGVDPTILPNIIFLETSKDAWKTLESNFKDSDKVIKPEVNYWRKAVNWLTQEYDDKWLENMRGMLSLISTMIATITFQFAINPPGGVVQADTHNSLDDLQGCRDNESYPCAGDAVSALIYQGDYHQFQKYNTICFIASLSVSLLLLSGIPLNRRFPIWILSLGMIIILSFLALTFLSGMLLATPSFESSWEPFRRIYKRTFITWIALVGMVGLFLTIRFLVWFITKCVEVFKHGKWMAPRN